VKTINKIKIKVLIPTNHNETYVCLTFGKIKHYKFEIWKIFFYLTDLPTNQFIIENVNNYNSFTYHFGVHIGT